MEDSTKVNLEDLHGSEDFCEWLKKQNFSDAAVKAFEEEEIDGPAFLDLAEHDFKEMGLKKGAIKNLLRLQKKHKPDQTQVVSIPKEPNMPKSTYSQEDSGSTKQQDSREDSQADSQEDIINLKEEVVKGQKLQHADSKKDTNVPARTKREEQEITLDPTKPIEEMDTDYFCKFLEQNRISDDAIAVFRKENVSGTVFPDLNEGDLKDMGLKMGDKKLLMQLQGKHIPKRAQESQDMTKRQKKTYDEESKTGFTSEGQSPSENPKLAEKTKAWCTEISKGKMSFYQLPQQDITRSQTDRIATVQVGPKTAHLEGSPGKVLMVVGATGAGKSTLINAMVNYLFGVDWEDDFRFKMIVEEAAKDQSRSVTKWITAYTIPAQEGSSVPYTLTIIDTPGFGDTEGIERDKLIVKQVKELFSKKGPGGIDQLHGIGFVAQSALARLTHTQRYIFDSILAIFGKDVGKNVFMMITFADGQRPPVLDAVKASKISYETAFKFNNSAIYSENKQDAFDRLFWEMGMSSFLTFFTSLGKMAAISLQLTRQVLHEREHLEAIMKGLQDQIQKGLNKIEDLRQTKDVVKKHEADIERNKVFEIPSTIDEPHKVDLQVGEHTTNCLKCNYTCHFPCRIPDTKQKRGCAAMEDENCTICTGKCHWTQHVNDQYRIEWRKRTVKRTVEELKKKYHDAKSGKSKYESIVGGLERELERKGAEVYENIKRARECVQSLEEIALKPNPLSEVEYIELMIESEKQQKRPGFNARIATLAKVKKQAELLSKVTKGNIEKLKTIKGKDEKSWSFFSKDDN